MTTSTIGIFLVMLILCGRFDARKHDSKEVVAANIQDAVFYSNIKGVSPKEYGRSGFRTSGLESLSRVDVKKIQKTSSRTFNKVHLGADEFNIKQCPDVKCHLSLTFVLDSSTSVGAANFGTQLRFVKTLTEIMALKADHYGLKVCLGIVTYSTYVRAVADPCCQSSLCSLIEHIERESLEYRRGGTNTTYALKVARQMSMATTSEYKVVFLITDGKSNYGGSPKNIAKLMRDQDGIDIMALGVSNSINDYELQLISGYEYVAKIDYFDEFHGLADLLLQANDISQEDLDTTVNELCKKDNSPFHGTKCESKEERETNCHWKSVTSCSGDVYCRQQWNCISSLGTVLRIQMRSCPCETSLEDLFMRKSSTAYKNVPQSSGGKFLEEIRRKKGKTYLE